MIGHILNEPTVKNLDELYEIFDKAIQCHKENNDYGIDYLSKFGFEIPDIKYDNIELTVNGIEYITSYTFELFDFTENGSEVLKQAFVRNKDLTPDEELILDEEFIPRFYISMCYTFDKEEEFTFAVYKEFEEYILDGAKNNLDITDKPDSEMLSEPYNN